MNVLGRKTFNDTLAILLLAGIPGLWLGNAVLGKSIPAEALGSTISVWTMVAMFYFRKLPPANGNSNNVTPS